MIGVFVQVYLIASYFLGAGTDALDAHKDLGGIVHAVEVLAFLFSLGGYWRRWVDVGWAFALGASFSGFAGAAYASYLQVVSPDQFNFSISVIVLVMVILGGMGNVWGVILGAFIIGFFDNVLVTTISQ